MEYKKITNMLDNIPNQPSKFKTKIRVEINDESLVTYNSGSQFKFKTLMIASRLCDYNDAYIVAKGTITVENTVAQDANHNNRNKKVIFKSCASFIDCIGEI